jgi:hypothetical protein
MLSARQLERGVPPIELPHDDFIARDGYRGCMRSKLPVNICEITIQQWRS